VKLYADGEHQQDDADLCELLERVGVGYGQAGVNGPMTMPATT